MAWHTDRKLESHGSTAQRSEDFNTYIERQRELARQQQNTAELHAQLHQKQAYLATLTHRYQLRRKWKLEGEMRELQQLIERRESGIELAELETKLAPYIQAYKDAQQPAGSAAQSERSSNSCRSSSPPTRRLKRTVAGTLKKGAPLPKAAQQALRQSEQHADAQEKKTYQQDSIRHELMATLEQAAPPVYVVQNDMCDQCNVPMIVLASEALLGCPKCSRTRLYIQATSSRIAYGEEVEFANFSYKRQNHFQEWLSCFQAKESSEVPKPILQQVMEELFNKRKVRKADQITQKLIREVLKDLHLRRYYDNAPQITARITGRLPPRMSPFQCEQVKLMFSAIQGPFNIHCPPERTNFLSYGYCLYKFCELLGYDEFLGCFTLLKGKDKLAAMDRIWKKICDELDWQFISSTTHLHNGLNDFIASRVMQRFVPA